MSSTGRSRRSFSWDAAAEAPSLGGGASDVDARIGRRDVPPPGGGAAAVGPTTAPVGRGRTRHPDVPGRLDGGTLPGRSVTFARRPPGTALLASCAALAGVALVTLGAGRAPLRQAAECGSGAGLAALPCPSELPLQDYEARLYAFLSDRTYTTLGWAVDREVRDTGPFVLGADYGTHPAVRIFYSPGILAWLEAGREGPVPDGAMMIKEMFAPPAARYREMEAAVRARYPDDPQRAEEEWEAALQGALMSWTVMVKDRRISKDGWFWSNPGPGSAPDAFGYPFAYPASGTGLACLRCHASADGESTFASLANVRGFESAGAPLRFRVDESWRTWLPPQQRPGAGLTEAALFGGAYQHVSEALRTGGESFVSEALPAPSPTFLAAFPPVVTKRGTGERVRILPPAADQVQAFPGQWADHVPAGPDGPDQFITSDNCLGCHGGLGGAPAGITMFVQTGPSYGDGYNVSEFGEWRWAPMGLAGRDPIFFAQLESELALLADDARARRPPFATDSSAATLRTAQQAVVNTCLSCHGAMGQRQLALDARAGVRGVDDPDFHYPDYLMLTDPLNAAEVERQQQTTVEGRSGPHSVLAYGKYGNLAREGISCALCHHIDPPAGWTGATGGPARNRDLETFLLTSTTGVFPLSPPDSLNGPFADVRELPMENALGITPVENPYIRDSKLCGTCHVINLPNVDAPGDRPLHGLTRTDQEVLNRAARNGAEGPDAVPLGSAFVEPPFGPFQHSIEQATYLEWENSDFAWDPATARTCQDCHMPGGLHTLDGEVAIDQLETQIATIQDASYPEAEHDLPDADIDVPVRSDYRRHAFVGLNVFLLEMFDQFDRILGIDKSDYMTSATNGDELSIQEMVRQAREETVALDVAVTGVEGRTVDATVTVTNKVGHRFPSGVGFRRAFLEVVALRQSQGTEQVVWGSGRTDAAGVIVDGAGRPLPTEFFSEPREGVAAQVCSVLPADERPGQLYQPHHTLITRQDQVQIYEELVTDARGRFTTSFIHRDGHPKDNRLLPVGSLDPVRERRAFEARFGSGETVRAFMKATVPEGCATADPDFRPGSDQVRYRMTLPADVDLREVTVRATMRYQAIPPSWLRERFTTAPDGPGTRRLYYITSHLDTSGTPIEGWTLPLVSASAAVGGGG